MFKIIDRLGGAEAFLKLAAKNALREGRRPPSKFAFKMWKYHGRLPHHIQTMAAKECLVRGMIFDPAECENAEQQAARRRLTVAPASGRRQPRRPRPRFKKGAKR